MSRTQVPQITTGLAGKQLSGTTNLVRLQAIPGQRASTATCGPQTPQAPAKSYCQASTPTLNPTRNTHSLHASAFQHSLLLPDSHLRRAATIKHCRVCHALKSRHFPLLLLTSCLCRPATQSSQTTMHHLYAMVVSYHEVRFILLQPIQQGVVNCELQVPIGSSHLERCPCVHQSLSCCATPAPQQCTCQGKSPQRPYHSQSCSTDKNRIPTFIR